MPVWRQINDSVTVGQKVDDLFVAEIKHMVPPSTLVRNYGARRLQLPQEPEHEVPFARLVGPQMRLIP